jgi:hypothetical protein
MLSVSIAELFTQDPLVHNEAVPTSFMYTEVLDSSRGANLQASYEEGRRFLLLLSLLLRSRLQTLQQRQREQGGAALQPQSGPSQSLTEARTPQKGSSGAGNKQLESEDDVDMKFYFKCLKRHVHKITSEEVFRQLSYHFITLEALFSTQGVHRY